ncbi:MULTISPECIES: response regulator [Methanobacterium]|uniref:response regulator n=1 Tax=Methanobacterium TaxID=2160 RepID=UPI0015B6AD77|nr:MULTISPECIES: response regulator [Methanobacterium]
MNEGIYVLINVLIVEDEKIISLDLEQKLKLMGYTVNTACSGEIALKKVKNNKIDLVIMDIYLNGELDGVDTAIEIRKNYTIPIIYITASHDLRTHKNIQQTEPYAYLKKPFDDNQLEETIKNINSY